MFTCKKRTGWKTSAHVGPDRKTKLRKKTTEHIKQARECLHKALEGVCISGFPKDIALFIASNYKSISQLYVITKKYNIRGVNPDSSVNYNNKHSLL
jgi:hypothetical protein